jgi:2-polyprenyl-3-methyl-5-hydroxy-6-metoxy-1,4-benzoquinol methylase
MECRLCRSGELTFYYSQGKNDEYRFYKCNSCGLVNYDLSTGLNQEKYSEQYTDPFDRTAKINIAQEQTFRFIKSNVSQAGRAIDIGCGNGKLLDLLKKEGWNVKGLELSPLMAESIRETLGIEVIVGNFLENEIPGSELYDIVTLRHVLEHLPDPLTAMKKINSLLDAGGYAILEFPNIEAFDLKFKRFLQRNKLYKKKYKESYKPGHCNEYSKVSFSRLAEQTGFRVVIFETYSLNPIKNFIFNRFPVGNKVRTIIQKTASV